MRNGKGGLGINLVGTITFWFLFVLIFFGIYLVLHPFLHIFLISGILALLFYPAYRMMTRILFKNEILGSLVTTLLIAALIVVPLFFFVSYLTSESVMAYQSALKYVQGGGWDQWLFQVKKNYPWASNFLTSIDVKDYLVDFVKRLNTSVFSSFTGYVKSAFALFISFIFMVVTLFFCFKDGKKGVERLKELSPLRSIHDSRILKDLHDVTIYAIGGTLAAAFAQGVLSAIGFAVVGFPPIILGMAVALAALIPLVGAPLVWIPVVIMLFLSGHYGQAIFLLVYCSIVVGLIDNVVKWLVISKGQAQVHPLLILLSVFGGLSLFGFLGIIYGPALLALGYTMLHIYELEYRGEVEK